MLIQRKTVSLFYAFLDPFLIFAMSFAIQYSSAVTLFSGVTRPDVEMLIISSSAPLSIIGNNYLTDSSFD